MLLAPSFTFRITSVDDVQIVRRDELTCKDVAVAVDEDLRPEAEIRIMAVPGTTGGSCVIQKRENAANTGPRTLYPRHPNYVSVSALWAGLVSQVAAPYTYATSSP